MTLDSGKYIDVGRLMVLGLDPRWKKDVKKANYHKNGRPFMYSNALFAALGVIKTITGLSYKNLEGLCKESLGDANAPDHSTIHARINSLDISFDDSNRANIKTHDGETIRFAIDSTGMTPYKRGESIHEKWHVKRGFVKLHVIVDESDGTVLSAKLTDDGKGSGDALQLEELLDDALEKIELQQTGSTECVIQNSDKEQQHQDVELLGDGAYGSRKNVAACKKRNVSPILRLVVTSTTRGAGYGDDWSNLVREQFGCKTKGRRRCKKRSAGLQALWETCLESWTRRRMEKGRMHRGVSGIGQRRGLLICSKPGMFLTTSVQCITNGLKKRSDVLLSSLVLLAASCIRYIIKQYKRPKNHPVVYKSYNPSLVLFLKRCRQSKLCNILSCDSES